MLQVNENIIQKLLLLYFLHVGVEIGNALSKLVENGMLREDTKLYDFEKTVEYGAYNVEGKQIMW